MMREGISLLPIVFGDKPLHLLQTIRILLEDKGIQIYYMATVILVITLVTLQQTVRHQWEEILQGQPMQIGIKSGLTTGMIIQMKIHVHYLKSKRLNAQNVIILDI